MHFLPSMTFSAAVQIAFPNWFIAKHLYVSAWSESTFGICKRYKAPNAVKQNKNRNNVDYK